MDQTNLKKTRREYDINGKRFYTKFMSFAGYAREFSRAFQHFPFFWLQNMFGFIINCL